MQDPNRNRLCNLCYEWAIESLRIGLGEEGSKRSRRRRRGGEEGRVEEKEQEASQQKYNKSAR